MQLPVPNNRLSNLPLALGYLKASAEAAQIPGLQVEILEQVAQDRGGDVFLLEAILRHDPDLVGFSLYTWNATRALTLIRALKRVAPEILTLAGGPEVNRDGDFVLAAGKTLDFLVVGEGERTFVELLKAFAAGKQRLEQALPTLAGLAYHPSALGEWHFNPPRPAIEDLNLLPSVYLSGALDGFLGHFMMIELSRWCPSKCSFCYYGRQDLPPGGKRYFELERLRQELLFGLEHGVEQVHFVEANFNTLPHLPQIYQMIREIGANKRIRFYAELRGEAIDEAEAEQLAACNFGTVECGLQSAVPEVLARVRRKNHLPRFIRGIHLLRERGIEVFLDAILGLPGDAPETFRQTLRFIEANELAPYDLFHLQLLPGTQLKAEAEQHGLQWQSAPPYFALQTAQLSFEQLCELRQETLQHKGDDPAEIQGLPLPSPFSLVEPENLVQASLLALDAPIERLVFELESGNQSLELPKLARKLASEVTLWLRLGKFESSELVETQTILAKLSEPNPTGVWHIFIEGERPLTPSERKQLVQAIQHEVGYLDRLAVFALAEHDPSRFPESPSVNLYEVVAWQPQFLALAGPKTLWRIALPAEETITQWSTRLEEVAQAPGYGLCLSFPPSVSISSVHILLEGFALLGKTLFLTNLELAAGLAASKAESVNPFPLTVLLKGSTFCLQQPTLAELDRAALRWALVSRHLRRKATTGLSRHLQKSF